MALTEDFNRSFDPRRENDSVLRIGYASVTHYYDFSARMVVTVYDGYNKGGVAVTPFSQADRETLIAMRDKLIELKGNPPELPPEEAVLKASPKKFNL
ncbi:MAG: hypothetical protein EPN97_13980 [Alphaproteobacteria bacterium]|nr:MAG: hypothetical protein EPN97_13980 [Alphaproteobacteria bacterium]